MACYSMVLDVTHYSMVLDITLQHGFGYNMDHCWIQNGQFCYIIISTFYSHYNMVWRNYIEWP